MIITGRTDHSPAQLLRYFSNCPERLTRPATARSGAGDSNEINIPHARVVFRPSRALLAPFFALQFQNRHRLGDGDRVWSERHGVGYKLNDCTSIIRRPQSYVTFGVFGRRLEGS